MTYKTYLVPLPEGIDATALDMALQELGAPVRVHKPVPGGKSAQLHWFPGVREAAQRYKISQLEDELNDLKHRLKGLEK